MSARDLMITAAWVGGSVTVLICTFCFTRSPIEVAADLYEWATGKLVRRKRSTSRNYEGRRRLSRDDSGREADEALAADQTDSGSDTAEKEVAA